MKSVLVVTFPKFNRSEPFIKSRRNNSFSDLLVQANKIGMSMCLSRFEDINPKTKVVVRAWVYDKAWKKIFNQRFDLVLYRGKNATFHYVDAILNKYNLPVINHPKIETLCDDKLYTSLVFPEIMPTTFLINNHYESLNALYFIKTNKVVLKPRFGSDGKGVLIMDKSRLRNGIPRDTLIQEFVDSSHGYRKLGVKGYHDIRVIIINGKINHCYVRVPPPGSLLSNASRGGKKYYFPNEKLPASIQKIVRYIDQKLKDFPVRTYSADFMFDENKKPWLIEMNSKPGTLYYDGAEGIREKFHGDICRSLKRALDMGYTNLI